MDDLTPQVTTAAKIVFQDPGNQAAQEHFDLMKKRWMDNMERLRGLVDEAVDSSALIKAEGEWNQLIKDMPLNFYQGWGWNQFNGPW